MGTPHSKEIIITQNAAAGDNDAQARQSSQTMSLVSMCLVSSFVTLGILFLVYRWCKRRALHKLDKRVQKQLQSVIAMVPASNPVTPPPPGMMTTPASVHAAPTPSAPPRYVIS